MNPSLKTEKQAFTLIELIIVMAIIGLLALAGIYNYALSVKKAQLEVAIEQISSLWDESEVKAKTDYKLDDKVYCWGLSLTTWNESSNKGIEFVRAPWKASEKQCEATETKTNREIEWNDTVQIHGLALMREEISTPTRTLKLLFTPAEGILKIYETGNEPRAGVTAVDIALRHRNATNSTLIKTLRINSATMGVEVR